VGTDTLTPRAYVGVDSGGTRTDVTIRMISPEGEVEAGFYEVTETLSGALPPDDVPRVLRAILAELQVHAGDHDLSNVPVYIWISAAGFTPWTRDTYLQAMNELLPKLVNGSIRRAAAANDGVSLLLGSRADAIVIAGTGSTVITRHAGSLKQLGGHEWVACDEGSGFWIGMRAIRQAYRDYALEDRPNSTLVQRLRKCYSVEPGDASLIEKFRQLAIVGEDTKKKIAQFAVEVCFAADRGDRESQNIVKTEAESLADVTVVALRRYFPRSELSAGLEIVECGSVLANEFYRVRFENQVEMRLRSEHDEGPNMRWRRVTTGRDASLQLAADLAESPDSLSQLGPNFSPAVYQGR
jgi:N-acetylglucosamine kinase-like BadF-type ATPase